MWTLLYGGRAEMGFRMTRRSGVQSIYGGTGALCFASKAAVRIGMGSWGNPAIDLKWRSDSFVLFYCVVLIFLAADALEIEQRFNLLPGIELV
jgi:hypothetical protein